MEVWDDHPESPVLKVTWGTIISNPLKEQRGKRVRVP